jgi:protease-4
MFLFFAMIFFSVFGSFLPPTLEKGNIAVIPIEGLISTTEEGFTAGVESQSIIKLIEEAQKNDRIKAILLEINSPGGTPVATDEISSAVKEANKTTVAVIRETGTSGAFWVATAADRVFANRMSVTGSIGVQASRLEFAGLISDYNITYRRLTAGRLKDAGSRLREMTPEEQELFQQILDKLHNEFIKAVAQNRNLPEDFVKSLATGFVYLGSEAKELGLIDELGGKKEALKYIEKTLNITAEPVEYREAKTLFDKLSRVTAENFNEIGRGIGSALITQPAVSFT